MKNVIIIVLSVLLVGALMALQHMTVRCDAAAAYIDAFEECYPDYLDTVAEGDTYSDYYSLW